MNEDLAAAPPLGFAPQVALAREFAVVLLAALLLYLASVAPGALWGDSGQAQVRVVDRDLVGGLGLALSHPLYYLFAFTAQWLPFGESAFRTNLVSAIFGAVTVANLYLFLRLLVGRRTPAAIGAIALAVAHTFWQHCAVAEVYTVSTALLTAELLCVLAYLRSSRPRWLVWLFFANGLGISNHMLAILSLACYGVWLITLLIRRRALARWLPALAGAWTAGASIYIALVLCAWLDGAPWNEVLKSAFFGQEGYIAPVLNVLPGKRQIVNSILYLGLSFPTPTALLAFFGLYALVRSKDPSPATAAAPPRRVPADVRLLLPGLTAIHLLWAMRYDVPDQYTFFILALVLIAALIGLGAGWVLARRRNRLLTYALVGLALSPVLVYAFLPTIARHLDLKIGVARKVPYRNAYRYFLLPWKTNDRGAMRFATELAATLPHNAILVADSTTVRPIHYLMATDRWPRDVLVFPHRELRAEGEVRAMYTAAHFEAAFHDQCPIFVVSPQPNYCYLRWLLEDHDFEPAGLIYRAVRRPPGDVDPSPSED